MFTYAGTRTEQKHLHFNVALTEAGISIAEVQLQYCRPFAERRLTVKALTTVVLQLMRAVVSEQDSFDVHARTSLLDRHNPMHTIVVECALHRR